MSKAYTLVFIYHEKTEFRESIRDCKFPVPQIGSRVKPAINSDLFLVSDVEYHYDMGWLINDSPDLEVRVYLKDIE